METPQIEVLRVEIAKLELGPNDRLLVTVPADTSLENVRHLDNALRGVLGAPQRWLIKPDTIEVSVLSPSDREDETRA